MKNIKKQFKSIQQDLATALGIIDTLQDKVHDLEEQFKTDTPKPIMYSKNGLGYPITDYYKENDGCIYFKLGGDPFTTFKYESISYRTDTDLYSCMQVTHRFMKSMNCITWTDCSNWIDHIDILEGVDHYDSTEK